ncbi:hypothetical protein GDO86_001661 [Hymenochirus boettgeri]|uniref:Uncharacterized protein n=1 Tax=Hymenochirus boettgeri TaxID=247094 RepID=A0A8T2KDM5_9PIPI|nr:hypothetical protein GDO86_001661 [Hymenochirus boettgeri]
MTPDLTHNVCGTSSPLTTGLKSLIWSVNYT